jgi:hypothetical protein
MILLDFPTRRFWNVCLALVAALLAAVSLSAQRAERATLDITGYVIDAELDTATHHIAAKAQVTFTAPESADEVSFGFHPALKINKITDDAGKLLTGERLADGTIRVAPSKPFAAGQANHWTFDYEGVITGNEDGPVEGLKLAAIQEPITYLLYPARWFPTTGFMTDRFTAQLHIKVPQGMKVFASGAQGTSQSVTLASGKPGDEFDFNWDKPGFPGTVIAGRYLGPFTAGPGNVKVYLTVSHQAPATRSPKPLPRNTTSSPTASARLKLRTSPSSKCPMTPSPPHGLPNSPASWVRASPTNPAYACSPTPSPTSGGAPRSQPAHPQRRLDHQRHVPLRRADVSRRRKRHTALHNALSATSPPERSPTTLCPSPPSAASSPSRPSSSP